MNKKLQIANTPSGFFIGYFEQEISGHFFCTGILCINGVSDYYADFPIGIKQSCDLLEMLQFLEKQKFKIQTNNQSGDIFIDNLGFIGFVELAKFKWWNSNRKEVGIQHSTVNYNPSYAINLSAIFRSLLK